MCILIFFEKFKMIRYKNHLFLENSRLLSRFNDFDKLTNLNTAKFYQKSLLLFFVLSLSKCEAKYDRLYFFMNAVCAYSMVYETLAKTK